jgi:aarF domain-containing kinase
VIGIPDDLKYLMLEACAHLYHRDYGLLVQDVQKLGAITSKADMGPLEADLERIMGGMVERKPDGSMAVTTDFNQLLSQFDQVNQQPCVSSYSIWVAEAPGCSDQP